MDDADRLRERLESIDWRATLPEMAAWLAAVLAVTHRDAPFRVALPPAPPRPAFYLAARLARGWRWRETEHEAFASLGMPESERGALKLALLERSVCRAFDPEAPARRRTITKPQRLAAGGSPRLLDDLEPALAFFRLDVDGTLLTQSTDARAGQLLNLLYFVANGTRDVVFLARRNFERWCGVPSDESGEWDDPGAPPRNADRVSLDAPLDGSGDESLLIQDVLQPLPEEPTPPSLAVEAAVRDLEERVRQRLSELERRGLHPLGCEFETRSLNGDDISMEDVARAHGVSKQAVREQVQKVRRALRSLFQ
jgi:hypothetical protein